MSQSNAYAMIMAGGAGTRLWPLSRLNRPKPLLPLVESERSMFQISVERLDPIFPPERVLVVANPDLCTQLQAQAPEIPAQNFIKEPFGRDTAPAVGLGALHIHHRDPGAVMAVLTADHHIADEARFRQVLSAACDLAAHGTVVTLGITPDFPSTGFGYIERGAARGAVDGIELYGLSRFIEKPDEARAKDLIADGRYSWNSGMFIWPVQRVLAEFAQHSPVLNAQLEKIGAAIGGQDYQSRLDEIWGQIKPISVDYALMEHLGGDAAVIPVEMGWSDIGNFGTLYDILAGQGQANATVVKQAPLLLDSQRNLIMSERLVATIGVDDLVIVDTGDVLLVCHRERVQDVKKLVEALKSEQRTEYL